MATSNKTLQLLRNATVFQANTSVEPVVSAHDVAKSALQTQLAAAKDGEIILARYQDGDDIRTMLGVAYKPTTGDNKYEIFDNQGGNDAITQAINNLINGASSGYDTLKEIEDVIKGLNLAQVGGTAGDVITTISEANGQVNAVKASLSDIKLTGYSKTADTGAIADTDTVEEALSKIENAIGKSTAASADGSVAITQPTTGTSAGKTDFAVNVDGTTIQKTSGTGALKSGLTIIKETTSLDANVKEQYKLAYKVGENTPVAISGAETIKIYKDSSLHSVTLGHVDDTVDSSTGVITSGTGDTALCFVYLLNDGTYSIAAVNVESFLQESEFSNGLQVVNHVVSVLKDANSGKVRIAADTLYTAEDPEVIAGEKNVDDVKVSGEVDVLTVSRDGVKVDNIQAAITYAVQNATADLAISAAGDNYITAAVDANNNKKINVTADVQALTSTAGTPGVYNATTGAQETAPVAGNLTGDANSLADSSDIATKVKTYVDGAIAIEAARNDAKNIADIKAKIDSLVGSALASTAAAGTDTTPSNDFTVLTKVSEVDGVVQGVGSGANDSKSVLLKKVAATGAAADVSIADDGGYLDATNVEGALQELCVFNCGTY